VVYPPTGSMATEREMSIEHPTYAPTEAWSTLSVDVYAVNKSFTTVDDISVMYCNLHYITY